MCGHAKAHARARPRQDARARARARARAGRGTRAFSVPPAEPGHARAPIAAAGGGRPLVDSGRGAGSAALQARLRADAEGSG